MADTDRTIAVDHLCQTKRRGLAMRAFALRAAGEPPEFIDLPEPTLAPGEVMVRVGYSSLNPHDAMVASGAAARYLEYRYPVVLGTDFSGEVVAVGSKVTDLEVGGTVMGLVRESVASQGAFGELVAVRRIHVVKVPAGTDLGQAGACGLSGVTALQCAQSLQAVSGDRVLVHGAAGGVGSILVQLLVNAGVHVLATAVDQRSADMVAALGCSVLLTGDGLRAALDRRNEGHTSLNGGVDLVTTDAVELESLSRRFLARGAVMVSTRHAASMTAPGLTGVNVVAQPDRTALTVLAHRLADGSLQVPISRTVQFEDLAGAWDAPGEGFGKTSVEVGPLSGCA